MIFLPMTFIHLANAFLQTVQTNVRFLRSNNNISFADTNGPEKCCFEFFESRIPVKKVTHFEETDHRCPIRGVIFHTVKKSERCVYPSETWVQDIMNKLQTPANATAKAP
uniref:C-C motif chemokine n=1 Tax=Scleropages formosus TaxID=113540 RepID=A0A8C9RY96_SCLFO